MPIVGAKTQMAFHPHSFCERNMEALELQCVFEKDIDVRLYGQL